MQVTKCYKNEVTKFFKLLCPVKISLMSFLSRKTTTRTFLQKPKEAPKQRSCKCFSLVAWEAELGTLLWGASYSPTSYTCLLWNTGDRYILPLYLAVTYRIHFLLSITQSPPSRISAELELNKLFHSIAIRLAHATVWRSSAGQSCSQNHKPALPL